MSYLVLARKYRPRNFQEMVGQEHVVQALSNALTTQRLHHAYLFTGTRGVGKTTVSRILAKSLNCQGADGQGGITATPCGVCQACTDIDAGRFIDYTELDAASNRGVDEVQSLLEQAVYKPVQGRFKVFMIDEVHMLTNTAFNAMLKTLEEPPEYLKFVLATTDPQKVPVTVLSRCLQFNLRPMAPETVLEHLTAVLQAEQVSAEAQALKLLARAARGSMRDALSLTDQAIAFGNGTLLEGGVRQMLGTVDRGHVFGLIEALAAGDGRTVVETSEGLRRDGLSAASTLEEMTSVLQAMAVLQAVPSRAEAAADATDPDAAETARLAARMPADETQLLYSLCLHGRGELGLAPDEYAGLTMVLLRLLAFKPTTEKKTLNEGARAAAQAPLAVQSAPLAPPPGHRLPVVERPGQQNPVLAPTSSPAETAAVMAMQVRVQPPPSARDAARTDTPAAPIAPSEDGDFWHATVTQLVLAEAISALARELALQSQLVARDVDQWLLRVERESLNHAATRDKLQAALLTLGHGVNISIEIGSVVDSPARRNKLAAEARQRAAEEAIHNDPLVQSMMRDFDARIVPGTLRPV
ncbi:MAG: DNA polymerase III subunit gamma/tau [Variovorax sp.]|nr:MAG: DNA polymerase III subunit gamma/tau [Variovorax sp.]